jgi:hypothetical protein
MKPAIALTLGLVAAVLALGGPAQAKPTPVETVAVDVLADAAAIHSAPAAALREQSYFQAPQTPAFAGRTFPCRLQLRVFDKTQIARSCN